MTDLHPCIAGFFPALARRDPKPRGKGQKLPVRHPDLLHGATRWGRDGNDQRRITRVDGAFIYA